MATRLAKTIIGTSRHNISEIYIVSDSEIALYWIKSLKKVPVFVKNQRQRILTLKEQMEANGAKVNFYHVTTDHNPADAGTRGLTAEQINTHEWVRGPRWLTENPAIWPIKSIDATRGETEEVDIIVASNVQTPNEAKKQESSLIDLARFSEMDKALRVIARQSYSGDEVDRLVSNMQTEMHVSRSPAAPTASRTSELLCQNFRDYLRRIQG
ncbi:hypothetical protein Y032_0224g2703 [Ancylostoma ceylanicum]|uniref:Uncharacterized protein n=1 Tax=Ancylostoma ceylanicum TaxID=53326 RepID=A0A016SHD0_9BILA|nr:hypothetical protein Y032_0224g2703 [Ancylostoma ceylanicum]